MSVVLHEIGKEAGGLLYQSGFGNEFAKEALPGALPQGRNSPQRCWRCVTAQCGSNAAWPSAVATLFIPERRNPMLYADPFRISHRRAGSIFPPDRIAATFVPQQRGDKAAASATAPAPSTTMMPECERTQRGLRLLDRNHDHVVDESFPMRAASKSQLYRSQILSRVR